MNTDERFAEMALAIQQLAQRVIKLVQNEEKLTNLKPLSPRKTMTTPTKQNKTSYALTKHDCYKGVQNGRESRHLTMKKTNKEISYVLNQSEYHKEIQKGKESVHMITTEISEEQVRHQTITLSSVEDEALNTELIKAIPIDDIELKKEDLFTTRISK